MDVSTLKIGDRVWGNHTDNFGFEGVIVEEREPTARPLSRFKVRTDNGDEFWAYDFEIGGLEDKDDEP